MEWTKWLNVRSRRFSSAVAPQPRPFDSLSLRSHGAKLKEGFPRFSGTATDQPRAPSGSALEKARNALGVVFTPSQPVSDQDLFAGRNELLATIIRSVEHQKMHAILYGERGIGKTSLLHILALLARDARYVVRYATCGEDAEFSEIFLPILRDIPLLYHADTDPTSAETEEGRTFADLVPAGGLSVPQLSDLLAKVSHTRVLIILDEFDRARSATFRRAIAELIKNLSDRSARVQLVVAGVAANLSELIEHIPSIRRNIAGIQVPVMSAAEIDELISIAEGHCGVIFDADARTYITVIASGSPYLASLLGQHAGLAAVDRGALSVGRDDVATAVDQVAREFRYRVSSSSRHQAEKAKADGEGLEIGRLAWLTLTAGGRLEPDSVASLAGSTTDEAVVRLRSLAARHALVEQIPDDPAGAFRFREEAVPVLLWMEQVRLRFSEWSLKEQPV